MISKMNRSLLATLVIGLAATASHARAEAAAAAAAPVTAKDLAALNEYDCIGNVCVGMNVRVVGGEWAGHAGQVLAVDPYQDEITVLNSSGYTLTPRSYDVIADRSQPSATGCVANICIGDQVRLLVGAYAGRIGEVVDADDYNYTATILVAGRYTIEDIRDLALNLRPAILRPFPNLPRACAYGTYVYDIYRGCVRISYPYPRPMPHPGAHPMPRPYPQPRGRPMPPRSFPQPRGPMPHPSQPPRGPQGPAQPPRQGPQGPQGHHGGPGRH